MRRLSSANAIKNFGSRCQTYGNNAEAYNGCCSIVQILDHIKILSSPGGQKSRVFPPIPASCLFTLHLKSTLAHIFHFPPIHAHQQGSQPATPYGVSVAIKQKAPPLSTNTKSLCEFPPSTALLLLLVPSHAPFVPANPGGTSGNFCILLVSHPGAKGAPLDGKGPPFWSHAGKWRLERGYCIGKPWIEPMGSVLAALNAAVMEEGLYGIDQHLAWVGRPD